MNIDQLLTKVSELEADLKRAKDYDLTAAVLAKDVDLEEKLQHERENVARLSEALEFYSLEHEHWKSSIFEQNKAKETLEWLKKRREGK